MKIVWTKTAELTFHAEIEFILKKWNLKQVEKFINLVDDIIDQLKKFPLLGKHSESNDRFLVISKQTTLIYRILNDDIIELLLFWNNKWNPKNLKELLK